MAEDQAEFCQASSIRGVFHVHFLLSFLEELDCQLGLLDKVLYVYPKNTRNRSKCASDPRTSKQLTSNVDKYRGECPECTADCS